VPRARTRRPDLFEENLLVFLPKVRHFESFEMAKEASELLPFGESLLPRLARIAAPDGLRFVPSFVGLLASPAKSQRPLSMAQLKDLTAKLDLAE
jgi:hypothetical protein